MAAILPALPACGGTDTPTYVLSSAGIPEPDPAPMRLEEVEEHSNDRDGDKIPDPQDACELLPEDKDAYLDEDGCPEDDNDADGIPDVRDKDQNDRSCSTDPEDYDGYADADGCPERDNDYDTLSDLDDQCPMSPGPIRFKRSGCPLRAHSINVSMYACDPLLWELPFPRNGSTIEPKDNAILNNLAELLDEVCPLTRVEIQGHTDQGGDTFNPKGLSERRAKAARDYLINKGIDGSRLLYCGHGRERPIAPNTTELGRIRNRRVQFEVITTEPPCSAPTRGWAPGTP